MMDSFRVAVQLRYPIALRMATARLVIYQHGPDIDGGSHPQSIWNF